MNQYFLKSLLVITACFTAACTQTTPSMMNTTPLTVMEETMIDQVAYSDLTPATLDAIAAHYNKNGNSAVELTMTYDPSNKSFGKHSAGQALQKMKMGLDKRGVKMVNTDVMAVKDTNPTVIISYDVVTAQAPADCDETPGLYTNKTGRFVGDYKFGCGVETMFAKQIAHPADLLGNDGLGGENSARRATGVAEPYLAGVPRQPLEGVERDNTIAQ